MNPTASQNLLQIVGLKTHIPTRYGVVRAVDGVTLDIRPNATLGLVGESGSGKTMLAQSILQIQSWPARIVEGSVLLQTDPDQQAVDLAKLKPKSEALRRIRGKQIAYIHQEPGAALSPLHTIGNQIIEAIRVHHPELDKQQMRQRAIEMLARVGLPGAADCLDSYVFRLSGGMRQRVMIAMALINHPALLIADEPTTAVDVTIQAQILDLFQEMREQMRMSILFVTHNLGVLAEIADEVAVMYLGRIVERAGIHDIFDHPQHPYTQALISAMPSPLHRRGELSSVRGNVPSPFSRPGGCPFSDRCDVVIPGKCEVACPELTQTSAGHQVRCFHYSDRTEQPVALTVGGKGAAVV